MAKKCFLFSAPVIMTIPLGPALLHFSLSRIIIEEIALEVFPATYNKNQGEKLEMHGFS
jgi:hypothetical protein